MSNTRKIFNSLKNNSSNEYVSMFLQEIFKEENRLKIKKIIISIIKWVLVLAILLVLFILYAKNISTTGFVIREERVINKKLPPELNGLKIVQFSDLHYGSTIKKKEINFPLLAKNFLHQHQIKY